MTLQKRILILDPMNTRLPLLSLSSFSSKDIHSNFLVFHITPVVTLSLASIRLIAAIKRRVSKLQNKV